MYWMFHYYPIPFGYKLLFKLYLFFLLFNTGMFSPAPCRPIILLEQKYLKVDLD